MKTKLSALLVASWFCALGADAHASNAHYFDIIQDDTLWRVNPTTGSYTRLGRTGDWANTTSLTSEPFVTATPHAFVLEDYRLWNVSMSTGAYTEIPLSGNGYFYGPYPQIAVGFYNNALTVFLAQGHQLAMVDPTTGVATKIPGTVDWSDPNAMVYFNGYLYLLEGYQLWKINPSSGRYYDEWDFRIPASEGLMAVGSDSLYIVQNKALWRYDGFGATQIGGSSWSGATSLAVDGDASPEVAFIIKKGNLYSVNTTDGSYTQLGGTDWTGTTFATFSTEIVIQ
jgi:hypothetical protein